MPCLWKVVTAVAVHLCIVVCVSQQGWQYQSNTEQYAVHISLYYTETKYRRSWTEHLSPGTCTLCTFLDRDFQFRNVDICLYWDSLKSFVKPFSKTLYVIPWTCLELLHPVLAAVDECDRSSCCIPCWLLWMRVTAAVAAATLIQCSQYTAWLYRIEGSRQYFIDRAPVSKLPNFELAP